MNIFLGLMLILAILVLAFAILYASRPNFYKATRSFWRIWLNEQRREHNANYMFRRTQRSLDNLLTNLDNWWQSIPEATRQEPAFESFNNIIKNATLPKPPRHIPKEMVEAYTLNKTIPVIEKYRDNVYATDEPLFYKVSTIQKYETAIREGDYQGPRYGQTNHWLAKAFKEYPISGKSIAIMGSNRPWFESMCLAFDGICTTIEYNSIETDHPSLKFLTPAEYDKNPIRFDAAISISSFEHDGLGRYGDPLNPNGDLEAMKKMKKIIKKDGLLYLSVPVGQDLLIWNLHRIYGRIRLPMLLEGWKVVHSYGFEESLFDSSKNLFEPIFVLQNT